MTRRNSRKPDETPEEREAEKARVAAKRYKGQKAEAKKPKRKVGSGELSREEMVEETLRRVAEGEGIAEVCRDARMPCRDTWYKWLREDAALADRYARAREEQADFYADEIVSISDTETDAAKARNRIDARKWKAARLAPTKYGDRLHVEHSVGDLDTAALLAEARAIRERLGGVVDGLTGGDKPADG